jgi:signal transduction histidine kinase
MFSLIPRIVTTLILWFIVAYYLISNEVRHNKENIEVKIKATEKSLSTISSLRAATSMADYRANKNLEDLMSDIFRNMPWSVGAHFTVEGEVRCFFSKIEKGVLWKDFQTGSKRDRYEKECMPLSSGEVCLFYDTHLMINNDSIFESISIKNFKIQSYSLSLKGVTYKLGGPLILAFLVIFLVFFLLYDFVSLFRGSLSFFSQISLDNPSEINVDVFFLKSLGEKIRNAALKAIETEKRKRIAELEYSKARDEINVIVMSARQVAHDSLSSWHFLDIIISDIDAMNTEENFIQTGLREFLCSLDNKIKGLNRYKNLADGVLRDLLELGDEIPINRVAFDIKPSIEGVISLVSGSYFGGDRFWVNLDHKSIVLADKSMDRVFLNLIKNCHEAAPFRHRVHISSSDTPDGVLVKVGNTGSSFCRRKEGGHGLGLIICEKILNLHSSKLFSTEISNGVEFSFLIPKIFKENEICS